MTQEQFNALVAKVNSLESIVKAGVARAMTNSEYQIKVNEALASIEALSVRLDAFEESLTEVSNLRVELDNAKTEITTLQSA